MDTLLPLFARHGYSLLALLVFVEAVGVPVPAAIALLIAGAASAWHVMNPVTAFALAPLLFEAERPGTEVLHPVAVVIFSGLISSTLLDTFLTPAMFWLFGGKPVGRLVANSGKVAF